MDGKDVDPPVQQALEVLREAIRKIEGETPIFDQTRRDYPQCDGGLDCQCPFHWHEAQIRATFSIPPPDTGWPEYPGECTKCGLDDLPVKGPPGAELCTYCDQLRIEPPSLPVKVKPPRRKIIMLPQGPLQIPTPPDVVLWVLILATTLVMGVTFALFLLSLGNP